MKCVVILWNLLREVKSKPVTKMGPVLEDFIKEIVYKYASQDCSLNIRIKKLFVFVMVNVKYCTEKV